MISEKTIRKLIVKKSVHEDEVEYTCKVDEVTTSSKLIVVEKPSPPRGPLEVSGMSANSFTIKWLPSEFDGGCPIIEYGVEMREEKTEFRRIGFTKGDVTDMPIKQLQKDHAYFFRITSKNEIGVSDPYEPKEPIVAGSRLSKYILFFIICFA